MPKFEPFRQIRLNWQPEFLLMDVFLLSKPLAYSRLRDRFVLSWKVLPILRYWFRKMAVSSSLNSRHEY